MCLGTLWGSLLCFSAYVIGFWWLSFTGYERYFFYAKLGVQSTPFEHLYICLLFLVYVRITANADDLNLLKFEKSLPAPTLTNTHAFTPPVTDVGMGYAETHGKFFIQAILVTKHHALHLQNYKSNCAYQKNDLTQDPQFDRILILTLSFCKNSVLAGYQILLLKKILTAILCGHRVTF